jgi:hypothetical protein
MAVKKRYIQVSKIIYKMSRKYCRNGQLKVLPGDFNITALKGNPIPVMQPFCTLFLRRNMA